MPNSEKNFTWFSLRKKSLQHRSDFPAPAGWKPLQWSPPLDPASYRPPWLDHLWRCWENHLGKPWGFPTRIHHRFPCLIPGKKTWPKTWSTKTKKLWLLWSAEAIPGMINSSGSHDKHLVVKRFKEKVPLLNHFLYCLTIRKLFCDIIPLHNLGVTRLQGY